jgi:polysaccharide export outer membrane protein
MRGARLLFAVLTALMVSACARQQPAYYVMDPNTGQPVPVVTQQQYPQSDYAQQTYLQPAAPSYDQAGGRGLFSSSPAVAQQAMAQQAMAQQAYAQQNYVPPAPQAAPSGRGLFNTRMSAPQAYAPQVYAPQVYAPQPYVAQTYPPQTYAPQTSAPHNWSQPIYVPPQAAAQGGPDVAAPYGYASAPASGQQQTYTLDSGDKLRVVVFGQDGISNSYTVDAGGNVNLPLIGSVPARGYGTQQLSQMIAERLKQGYVREPHVSVEIETYRPFFILGEVTNPGQYPYVANMTAETAVAIAGGFAPRASKSKVELTRNAPGQQMHGDVPLGFPLRPGDTVVVKERWF